MENVYLCHYGVEGMHWGVRRYQNADGSLTAAGRNRYGTGEAHKKGYELANAQRGTISNMTANNIMSEVRHETSKTYHNYKKKIKKTISNEDTRKTKLQEAKTEYKFAKDADKRLAKYITANISNKKLVGEGAAVGGVGAATATVGSLLAAHGNEEIGSAMSTWGTGVAIGSVAGTIARAINIASTRKEIDAENSTESQVKDELRKK